MTIIAESRGKRRYDGTKLENFIYENMTTLFIMIKLITKL